MQMKTQVDTTQRKNTKANNQQQSQVPKQAKISSFKKSSYKKNRPIIIIIT